jgi:hypothetical protein
VPEENRLSDESFDFAIMGTSAFAAILSLALARKHGAKVCLIGRMPAPLQTVRDIALSAGPYSRPETLRLLGATAGDLRALLAGPGEPVFERRNALFAASSAAGRAAAGHARHMLAAFGVVTSSLPETAATGGFVAEGLWSLKPRAFFAGLVARLAEAGVVAYPNVEDLQIGRDVVRFAPDHAFVTATRLVVTDASESEAMAALPETLAIGWRKAMLTEPVPGLAGRLIVDIDTGGHIMGRADGRLEVVAPAEAEGDAAQWLGAFLPRGSRARVVARNRYRVLQSSDGAAVIAPLPRKAAMIAAGLGVSGAFLAPALARHLTASASTDEGAWFAARDFGGNRSLVADIGLVGGGTP